MSTVTAIQIATEMKIPAKRVRAVLRDKGYFRAGGRWKFDASMKAELKRIIRASQRKPAKRSVTVH